MQFVKTLIKKDVPFWVSEIFSGNNYPSGKLLNAKGADVSKYGSGHIPLFDETIPNLVKYLKSKH